jgi:ABC-type uncharacterized transport system involved in gliding motility auxiliary subunit
MRLGWLALFMASCGTGGSDHALKAAPPAVQIMTALPLFWGEGGPADIIQGASARAPVIAALEAQFKVAAIDVADAPTLSAAPLLILAQPTALRPEELVAIDNWVRGGGQALIFADPALMWPSTFPIADPRHPPVQSLLGPLLAHWGLSLGAPERGQTIVRVATMNGKPVSLAGAGRWSSTGPCQIENDALTATCRIGQGRVLLVADADMFDARLWAESGVDNRAVIVSLLTQLNANDPVERSRKNGKIVEK